MSVTTEEVTLLCMLLHSSHRVKITLTPAQLLMLGVKKRKSSNLFNIIYTIKVDRYVTDIFGRRQAAWVNMSFLDTGLHVYVWLKTTSNILVMRRYSPSCQRCSPNESDFLFIGNIATVHKAIGKDWTTMPNTSKCCPILQGHELSTCSENV